MDPRHTAAPDASPQPAGTASRPATTVVSPVWDVLTRLGPLTPLAAVAATLPAVGGFVLLAFAGPVGGWLRSHGLLGAGLYVALFTVLAGLALLPTYAQALVGGFAFRLPLGAPAACAGYVGAALLGYAIARLSGGDRAMRIINERSRWRAVYDSLLGSGFWRTLGIVTLLRVPPNSPFAITNLVLAATRVPLRVFVLGTLLGMAPRTVAAVYVGSTLHSLADASRPRWMVVAGIVSVIVVVLVIGRMATAALSRVTSADASAQGWPLPKPLPGPDEPPDRSPPA